MSNQPTSQVLGATGGGVVAEHPTLPTHEVLVSPTPADKRNTIRAAILPLACWRCDDIRFDFDSSFVRPEIANELRSLADLREKHPRATISIFGHADPVGDDVYNKQLSGRRATVIYGLLTRDADLWENLYQQEHWDARTIQTMLATVQRPGAAPLTLSDSPVPPPGVEDATGENNSSAKNPPKLSTPYYTGAIDGQVGSQTTAAVKDFQADRGLASDGVVGPNTRRELFLAYMDTICRDQKGQPYSLDKYDDFLARGEDPGGKGDYQGCSEFNPKLIFSQDEEHRFRQYGHRDERNAENALNRRVIALMFRPEAKVSPEFWPCPRVKEGTTACKKRFWSNGEHRRSHHLPTERREFETTQDTFACRFYHRLTVMSPCEHSGLIIADNHWIVRLEAENGPRGRDSVVIESMAVSYRNEVMATDAKRVGEFLDFCFPIGPKGDYNVWVKLGGTKYAAWMNLHLPNEGQGEQPPEDDDENKLETNGFSSSEINPKSDSVITLEIICGDG